MGPEAPGWLLRATGHARVTWFSSPPLTSSTARAQHCAATPASGCGVIELVGEAVEQLELATDLPGCHR